MRISERAKVWIERGSIILAILGIIFLAQPFSKELFKYGFQLLGLGGLIYIIMGYVPAGSSIKDLVLKAVGVVAVIIGFIVLGIVVVPSLLGL